MILWKEFFIPRPKQLPALKMLQVDSLKVFQVLIDYPHDLVKWIIFQYCQLNVLDEIENI